MTTNEPSDYDKEFWGDFDNVADVFKFLLGEGELQGCGFGEKPTTERGNFWWRKHLRAALSAQQEPVAWLSGGGILTSEKWQAEEWIDYGGTATPLYTTPPTAALLIQGEEKCQQS